MPHSGVTRHRVRLVASFEIVGTRAVRGGSDETSKVEFNGRSRLFLLWVAGAVAAHLVCAPAWPPRASQHAGARGIACRGPARPHVPASCYRSRPLYRLRLVCEGV